MEVIFVANMVFIWKKGKGMDGRHSRENIKILDK